MPIFNLQQSIKKAIHYCKYFFVFAVLAIFSSTLNAQNSAQTIKTEIYSDNQIKVEVEFKLYNTICKDPNKSNKYSYIVTGQLYSFTKEVNWDLKYIDCNGKPQIVNNTISIGGNEAVIGLIESIDYIFVGHLDSNNDNYIKAILEGIEDLVMNNKFIEAKSELESKKSIINDAAVINKRHLLIYDKAEKYYIDSLASISILDKKGLQLANNLIKEAEALFPYLPNNISSKKKELETINLEQNRIEIKNKINQLVEQDEILTAFITYNKNTSIYRSQELEKTLIKVGETSGNNSFLNKDFNRAKDVYDELYKLTGNKNYLDEIEKCKEEIIKQFAEKQKLIDEQAEAQRIAIEKQAAKEIKEEVRQERKNKYDKGFASLGIASGEIAKYGLIYESTGRDKKFMGLGFHMSLRTSATPEEDIINGTVKENKTEFELGPNFRIFRRLYLNLGVGYGYYDRIMNNDYAGEVYLEKTGYSVATSGLMFRISRVININAGVSFMDIEKDIYKPELTFGATFNLKRLNSPYVHPSRNYKPKLSSFSSLGFQSGEIAKYGLLYETGGRKIVGFRISARTTLKPEEIFSGEVIENKKEIELGPNFRMSNRIYLNVGVGYGNYDYVFQDDFEETIKYYLATTGLMFRVSRVININGGLSFMDIDKEIYKPEITFGISFNLRGKYKY